MTAPHEFATDYWPLAGVIPGQVVVIARWRTTPKGRDLVHAALPALAEASLAEPGCLGYQALTPTGTTGGDIVLIERYADRDAFEAHRASPHFQQIVLTDIAPHLHTRDVTVCMTT
ncbi:antibiotic biosynthesis monooxygenase [Streptomyces polychromogenes]|uniref:Antibiotic biosynthesis monooxygenase n=1 Tax=Streptomyces polychromogenes TaxID=67342 RepID=A0ABN0W4U2_9ACTN